MTENFLNLRKETDNQIQEPHGVPIGAIQKFTRNVTIKLSEVKNNERILKAARDNKFL